MLSVLVRSRGNLLFIRSITFGITQITNKNTYSKCNLSIMTTIINNPGEKSDGVSAGLIIALLLVIIVGAFIYFRGLPWARQSNEGNTINIPEQVNIDVNTPKNE